VSEAVGIGLDVGASKTLGVLVDASGHVRAQVRMPTARGTAGVLETAAAVTDRLLGGSPPGSVTIGVGVPGVVDVLAGVVQHAVNLGLDGARVPMRDLLTDRLGAPVHLENDVNAAAFGAAGLVGEGFDLAYLSIGTGLAAGLVLDGRLRRGAHDVAGEIGHVPVDLHGERCACGQAGCLEVLASGSALRRLWPVPDGTHPGSDLFRAAAQGEPRAVGLRDTFAAAVATAVRLVCLTVDVDRVVIGGGVAQIGEPLRAAVERQLRVATSGSPFLHSLDLADRLVLVPKDHPVAALGAAMLGLTARLGQGAS
jgi:predicted NBD/HSP70 family sugar kinase